MNIFKFLFKYKKDDKQLSCAGCPYQIKYEDSIEKLTFQWHDISEETVVPVSGLYLIQCYGDNHILYELHECLVNTLFCSYFSDTSIHFNGWNIVKPIAYYYIPSYKKGL